MKDKEILELLEKRIRLLKSKKYKEANLLRDKLKEEHIEIYDIKEVYKEKKRTCWKKGKKGNLHFLSWN